jgi:hypothetical protein
VQQPVIQPGTAIDGDIFSGGTLDCGQKIKPGSHFNAIPYRKSADISKGILTAHRTQPPVAAVTPEARSPRYLS